MLMNRDEGEELRPPQWELEEGSFEELSAELADGTITRARAIKLAGAALLSASGLMMLFQSPAEAGRRRKKRRKKRRRRKRNVTSTPTSPLNFGDTNINLPAQEAPLQDVTISNNGPDTVELRPVVVGDGFTLVDGAKFTLAPNDTKVLQVTFDPDKPLLYEGELKIVDTRDGLVVENVDLLGQGIDL